MKFNPQEFRDHIYSSLKSHYGKKDLKDASPRDIFYSVSSAVMDYITDNWIATREQYEKKPVKQMYYLSAEFLMGRALGNNLMNLCIKEEVKKVLKELGLDYNLIENEEPDAGLGNGGLGRLAACFLDSLATLDLPGHGYGIRYEYGMFSQKIVDGYQIETPDVWLRHTDPWSIKRSDLSVIVKFGGYVSVKKDENGKEIFTIENTEDVTATPYDTPIVGYDTNTVNTLRLWEASSPDGFNLQLFNDMQYARAVEQQNSAEDISRVLYPNDNGPSGKILRLKQQYFFSSASLQDLVRAFVKKHGNKFSDFPKYHAIQLNDTHPVVAIPEMMRILMDEHGLGWDEAWDIVTKTFAYTNHTILAEALEKWPIQIFQGLLPRIYQIVEEINRRFMITLREKYPQDWEKQNRMAIIGDGMVKMAWLAIHAGYSVNGVAALHTELLKTQELKDWYELYPEKFNNKTNGVTQRRWLLNANEKLSAFITETIGHGWEKDLTKLKGLEKLAKDEKALKRFMDIKRENKVAFASYLKENLGVEVNPDSIFDVQIKRLHEYKRQFLNILNIMYMYNRLLEDPTYDPYPRTFIFGAKAASGYRRAKSIIKLINTVAERINNDHRINGKIKVVFIPDYKVSIAEKIFPAADVSEQISTAGLEASGTGNMKFMLNGALTLGTLDGANVEIAEEAGSENVFIFGHKTEEILAMDAAHQYNPHSYLDNCPGLAKVVNQLIDGTYSASNTQLFRELHDSLVYGVDGQRADTYYILADFESYVKAQQKVEDTYRDSKTWAKMALLNVARSGKFSSDRTIMDYATEMWKIKPVEVK
ncbi:MAG: glycogen/starch/alpha-glucan phosphorylase [Spirochaetes bacterium]|uniref:Alpha-1,4 glucan phosphorylase n=1 Tax=Candidatus Gallitreponema excrementavium TaxID=2840840 RepID=A0A9D9N306_9SPIR|nr:glycogen/starch/alpha-glucan phosphorylase [Candidatus Gallitreponema excrementavium]